MATSSLADGVRALAGPAVAAAGLVLESVTITPAGRRRVLRVVVDLPDDALGGVPMESVATASQALSAALDASDVMGGAPYVLEVTSPGADRPLTEARHWRRARGRLVTATLADGSVVTGRVTATDDAGVVLGDATVPWAELRSGRVELEFSRPDGPDDLDGDGPEEDPDDGDRDDEDVDDEELDDADLDDDGDPGDGDGGTDRPDEKEGEI